jgi:hypothetical protein
MRAIIKRDCSSNDLKFINTAIMLVKTATITDTYIAVPSAKYHFDIKISVASDLIMSFANSVAPLSIF